MFCLEKDGGVLQQETIKQPGRKQLAMPWWGLLALILLIVLWHSIRVNWEMLRDSYSALPGRAQMALVALMTAAVLLMLHSIGLSLVGTGEPFVSAAGSWLSAATALLLVSHWLKKL